MCWWDVKPYSINLFTLEQSDDLLLFIAHLYSFHLGVTPHLFHLSDLVCPLYSINSPTFFVRVSSPWRLSPGVVRPPTPSPSDATEFQLSFTNLNRSTSFHAVISTSTLLLFSVYEILSVILSCYFKTTACSATVI